MDKDEGEWTKTKTNKMDSGERGRQRRMKWTTANEEDKRNEMDKDDRGR